MEEEDPNTHKAKRLAEFGEVMEKLIGDFKKKGWNAVKVYEFASSFQLTLLASYMTESFIDKEVARKMVGEFVKAVEEQVANGKTNRSNSSVGRARE